jgi:hypothetical protein
MRRGKWPSWCRYSYSQPVTAYTTLDLVTPTRVRALVEETVKPSELGLTRLRPGFYVRDVGLGMFQILKASEWQGAAYDFTWGVSLPFVPHEWKARPRFHRTLKSARLDLFECGQDRSMRDGHQWHEVEAFDTLYGESVLRQQLEGVWERAQPRAEAWWDSVQTVDAVLAVALRQSDAAALPRLGLFSNWPPPLVVAAFAAASLGRISEAEELLAREDHPDIVKALSELRDGLRVVAESNAG